MKISYRLHTKEDEPELIRLWSEHSGWDQPDADTWKKRLMNSPFGETRIVVASDIDSGQIIGQFVFIPTIVKVGDREIKAIRPFAPIITRSIRKTLLRSVPIKTLPLKMYMHGVKELRRLRYGLIHAMPDPRWRRFLSLVPDFHFAVFPLWSLKLPLKSCLPLGEGFSEIEYELSDPRIDVLWNSFKKIYKCSVIRDSRFWSRKTNLYGYKMQAIEKEGKLIGLVGSLKKGGRQWLICDMISLDNEASLKATLTAACNLAHKQALEADPHEPIEKAALLVTPVMEPVVKNLGFFRDAYDFSLLIHKLDRTIAKEDVNPANWYVCATD